MISFKVPDLYHRPICWFSKEFLMGQSVCIVVEERDLGHTLGYVTKGDDEYLVEINYNQSDMEKLTTFFHEMYHILQYIDELPRDELETETFESILLDRYIKCC